MIRAIRGITVVILFAVFGLGALFIRYLIFPFQKSKSDNYRTLQKSWQFFIWLLKSLKIIKLEVKNIDKIKSIHNSIIVSTHPSFIDIVILMSLIPDSTCFVAGKLSNNPFFRGMVDLLFIIKSENIEEWLNSACDKLNSGLNVIIFPTGGRHRHGDKIKIHKGASLIAQKSKKEIIALKIDTDFDFLQTGQAIYDAGNKPVTITIDFIDTININKFIEKYPDEVDFKKELTKCIRDLLF